MCEEEEKACSSNYREKVKKNSHLHVCGLPHLRMFEILMIVSFIFSLGSFKFLHRGKTTLASSGLCGCGLIRTSHPQTSETRTEKNRNTEISHVK